MSNESFERDENFEAIARFLSEIRAEPLEHISPGTRLREDLGLDGDDVDEFLEGLADRFGVDLTGFDFYRYFREEPHLLWLFTQWWHARRRGQWQTQPITVADVVRTVREKRWIAPGVG
jgi:hypothetical protein